MIIDVHCHYTFSRLPHQPIPRFSFEPASGGSGEHPTDFDSCVSPRALRRADWRFARWWLDAPPPGEGLDAYLRSAYERHLFAPGPIDRYVLLAFDAVHDDDGRRVPLPRRRRQLGSDIYTSNSLVRHACQSHPERFLFGASVHPYRPDAPACVEEVFAGGACLLKWLPLHQNIDLEDARTLGVLRKCAELGLPVLVHVNEEYTLATQRPAYARIEPLLAALRTLRREGACPAVIVAHAATPVTPWGSRRIHRLLCEALMGEFADAPIYADTSALLSWTKVGYFRRLLRKPELHGKLLFGTDFPVPSGLPRLRRDLGRDYRVVRGMPSWPQQTATVFRLLGANEIVMQRAAHVLPNVDYFTRPASRPDSVPGESAG